MEAVIISIGDELLIGQVINTNAAYIAEELNKIGIKVYEIKTISDDREHLLDALNQAKSKANIIITTGGIGPTKDDMTKNILCEYFQTKLVFSEETYRDIESLFKSRGYPMTETNKKQAEVPEGCRLIRNMLGTAPGMYFEKDGKIFISLPGVPFEMKAMIAEFVLPELKKKSNTSIFHKTVLTQGVGESFLSDKIKTWEEALPEFIKLAYLPSPGIVRLRLSAYGNAARVTNPRQQGEQDELKQIVEEQIAELRKIISEYIFGYDNDTLEGVIGNLLKEKNSTLATAESCTGGYIAHRITSIAGSSAYYKGSVVAYANEIKERFLSVRNEDLLRHGAVSKEVAEQMAKEVKEEFKTDYSIAVTGIAGPDGGTDEKPVGTTWIAIATPDKVISQKFLFGDNRERNIVRTALTGMNILRKTLSD